MRATAARSTMQQMAIRNFFLLALDCKESSCRTLADYGISFLTKHETANRTLQMEMNKDLETRQAAQGQSFSQPANTLLQYGPKSKEHFFKNLHTLRTNPTKPEEF